MEQLPIIDDGRQVSHLAVRLDRPRSPRAADLCVLYLHGFGSHQTGEKARFFRRAFLDHGLDFCSFDFQGHGESGGGMLALTLSRNLADIGRVHGHLRALGYRRLVLFGSSMGGISALWYAALHPADFVAAVHIAPALALAEALLEWAGPEGARRWRREGRIAFASDLVTCELSWDLVEDLRAFDRGQPPRPPGGRGGDLQSFYRTPTLILQGKNDDTVPWRTVVDFATGCACEAIEVHLMGDGDHRLVDRLPYLWSLTAGFLEARGVV